MPKKETKKEETPKEVEEVVQETGKEAKGGRDKRWVEFLKKAKAQNPVKFAEKEANGEFKKIPDSFR